MVDCQFPHIKYDPKQTPFEWGLYHGELQNEGIEELAEIRIKLMLQKSPHLTKVWKKHAINQARLTEEYFPNLYQEILGIVEGSKVDLEKIIVLNNYTDFRDIKEQDEGCTSVGLKRKSAISGQTWDMHSSAKNFVCVIELPGEWITFSLVGCLGMMGANKNNFFIGVNNINTNDARPGVIWPAFVRNALNLSQIDSVLKNAKEIPFTSGHNYLLSDGKRFEHWEISPTKMASPSHIEKDKDGFIFHTNHCLSSEFKEIEEKVAQSSTTHDRYSILTKNKDSLQNKTDILDLLNSHEGFPKSICGHYESGAHDPSMTCGGGIFDHKTLEFYLWRGCKEYDSNFIDYTLRIS